VLRDERDPGGEEQAQRRIEQRIELGEPTPADPLEKADVPELSDGARQQAER
jgi:hypothetical protein